MDREEAVIVSINVYIILMLYLTIYPEGID